MELKQAKDIIIFLQNAGFEAELYDGYSGRGMYGKTTKGVTTDARPNTMEVLSEKMEADGIDTSWRSDSMGLDYIYY